MNGEIKISVIVPVYNLEKYIERCIKSILEQTYKNLEILIVDDGSSDNSRTVIEELCTIDNRIVPIYKENGGVTSARLAGIEKSTGDWIGFVDGDDEVESDMYELLLKNALENNADISHCGYQMVFSDGRINYFYGRGNKDLQDKYTGIKDLLEGTKVEPGLWNKLFKKELFNKLINNNLMDNDIKINEDLLMNYYLFSESNLSIFDDMCKYHYIIRDGSASRNKMNMNRIFDPIKVRKIILNSCDDKIKNYAKKTLMSTYIYTYSSLIISNENHEKELKIIRGEIINNRKMLKFISKKLKILSFLIILSPNLFKSFYLAYDKTIRKNIYE